MLIYFAVYFFITRYKITFHTICHTLHTQHIKKNNSSVLLSSFRQKSHNKNKFYVFFLTYILQYIFSLCETHVPFLFVVYLGNKLVAVKMNV